MARKPSVRVVTNRDALTNMGLALANGLSEFCRTVLDVANPPDRTPYGRGLVTAGGYLVYIEGNKVDGYGQDGKQPAKPRAFKAKAVAVHAVVGYGFPGRFQEEGTVHHGAQPFLTPAVMATAPYGTEMFREAAKRRGLVG